MTRSDWPSGRAGVRSGGKRLHSTRIGWLRAQRYVGRSVGAGVGAVVGAAPGAARLARTLVAAGTTRRSARAR